MARRPPGEVPPAPPVAAADAAHDWLDPSLPTLNDDLGERVVVRAGDGDWQPTGRAGLEMRLFERFGGDRPRLSAQLRLAPGTATATLGGGGGGLELLVQRGEVEAGDSVWPTGLYARLPVAGEERFDELVFGGDDGGGDSGGGGTGTLLYVATGHIADGDAEQRRIDTRDASQWLPGPVAGTEVQPLHGHGSANVMLIRWLGAVAFRPNLDPLGEEVLVLEGCLHDAGGDYPAGSWIRNPVPAWQSWSGDPGTVVYYKNGHFATVTDDERAAPDPFGE